MKSFRVEAVVTLLGLALVLGVLAFGATPGSTSSQASSPTYVEAMVGAPRLVNPLLASSDTDVDLTHLVFSGLARIDRTGNIVPDLASGWDVSADGRVYTFTLQPNLRWQDGKPLTAGDVKFTVGLVQSKDFQGNLDIASVWRGVQVDTLSDSIVRLTLPKSDASFLQYATLGLLPQHLWSVVEVADLASSELNRNPVGSGRWRFAGPAGTDTGEGGVPSTLTPTAQTAPGVLLEPNPYGPGTGTSFSHIWFRPYPSFGAALTGFQLGEVHGLGHIPADRMDEVRAVPGATLHEQTLARYAMLIINTRSPLFDSVQTRQAIEFAVDKNALAQLAYGRAADSPVLPHSWAYAKPDKPRDNDPSEARRLLDSAGWLVGPDGVRTRNGQRLSVVLAGNKDQPSNLEVAQELQRDLKAVGIDLQLAMVSRDALLKDYLAPRSYHLALVNWAAAGADPDLYAYWHSSQNTSGVDFSGWINASADSALEGGLHVADKAVRTRLYGEFQTAFAQDVPGIILYCPLYAYATRQPASNVSLPQADLLTPAQRFDTMADWTLRTDLPAR